MVWQLLPSIVSDQCVEGAEDVSVAMPLRHPGVSEALSDFLFPEGGEFAVAVVVDVENPGLFAKSRFGSFLPIFLFVVVRPSHSIALPGDEPLKEHLRHGSVSQGSLTFVNIDHTSIRRLSRFF